jgi:predicted MFS family arabinose efflux permease
VATWGVLVGLGTGTTAMVLGATVVSRWFVTRRGMVMGVLTASTATGQMLFLPLEAHVVEHYGWRMVTVLVASVLALLLPLVALLVRDRPSDLGLLPYGASPETAAVAPSRQNPLANALRVLRESAHKADFWLLAGSFFVCGATTNGLVGTHLIPACIDHGIPEVRAAGLLAVMGVFDLVGTTASGWLSDRFDSRKLLFWYYGLRGLALLWLPQAFDATVLGLPLFAVFYGLDWIATVPPTVRLTTEAVGVRDAPIAFGWIVASHQIGAGIGALGAGVIRSRLTTYTPAWIAAGAICLLAALIVLRIGRRAPRLGSAEPA